MPEAAPSTGISKVAKFFKDSFTERPNPTSGSGLTAFKAEWTELSDNDKAQLRAGIENGTLTY